MADREDAWEAAQDGAELIAEGEPDRARRVLEALVREQPDNEYAYFFLGSAHYELGNHVKALAAYVKALELAPNYVGAMINAGHTLRMLGRYDQAIRMGQQVLARDEQDSDALYLLGTAHFACGNSADAEGYFNRLLETHPTPELRHEVQGMLEQLRGRAEPGKDDEPPN